MKYTKEHQKISKLKNNTLKEYIKANIYNIRFNKLMPLLFYFLDLEEEEEDPDPSPEVISSLRAIPTPISSLGNYLRIKI
jgi:hypothetical protein